MIVNDKETNVTPLTLWTAFCQNPDEQTFAPLYEATKRLVFSICQRLLKNSDDAHDAFQGTYARLLVLAQSGAEAEAISDLPATVARLAVHESNMLLKRRGRRQHKEIVMAELPQNPAPSPSAADAAARRQMREQIEALLDAFPERYRLPLLMHYFHGLTMAQVAEALEMPVSTVSSRIYRGQDRLAPLLKKAGLGEAGTALAAGGKRCGAGKSGAARSARRRYPRFSQPGAGASRRQQGEPTGRPRGRRRAAQGCRPTHTPARAPPPGRPLCHDNRSGLLQGDREASGQRAADCWLGGPAQREMARPPHHRRARAGPDRVSRQLETAAHPLGPARPGEKREAI